MGNIDLSKERHIHMYAQTSNTSRAIAGNIIVDHSDVVGASTAPTTSSFST